MAKGTIKLDTVKTHRIAAQAGMFAG